LSSALAIASVTAVVKNLLDNGMIDDQVVSAVGKVAVTARAPDLITLDDHGPSQLNLFLYQVTPNQGWRNVGLPSRDAAGDRLSNPPLALDLHYLLTAYAARDLHAEILLGYAMQLLHETPVLPREGIRRALGVPGLVVDPDNALPPDLEAIASSDLAEQVEAIKIVPTVQSTEEVSKLWAAFQSRYRPSAAYLASVVLIESRRPTRAALPVGRRKLYVAPFREPRIERVLAQETGSPSGPARSDMPILARHRLVLRGKQLKGERTSVRVGGVTVRPDAASLTDTEIALDLPAGLSAGVQSVQVIHELLMGEPEAPHSGVESNLAAFVLHPEIVAAPTLSQGAVRLTIDPPIGVKQQVVLLLNERPVVSSPPVELPPPRAYSFVAPPQPASSPPARSNQIDVPIKGVASGTYLVRVQVDGAESPLGSDEKGRFDSPSLTIP
jgi:hypothetical protein